MKNASEAKGLKIYKIEKEDEEKKIIASSHKASQRTDPKRVPLFQIKENIWHATPPARLIRATRSYRKNQVKLYVLPCLHLCYTHIMST